MVAKKIILRSLPWLWVTVIPMLLLSCGPGNSQSEKNKLYAADSGMPDTLAHQKAKAISAEAFSQLSAALTQAIQRGGVAEAIQVCKLQALPITDSVAGKYGISLQRIALKTRNPLNLANSTEKQIFRDWKAQMEAGNDPAAVILHEGDSLIWYGAIRLANPVCLQCHGEPGKDISTENLKIIRAAYPEDQATGFVMGDLRGAWKIGFRN